MKTNKPYTVENYRGYGPITVPAGTALTHQTACGIDPNYHFVNELEWVKRDYPSVDNLLTHDLTHYGINVPIEFVDFENEPIDLFEFPELIPEEVQAVLDKHSEGDETYEECEQLVKDLNAVGYTCDYYLDAVPFDLRKL